MDVIRANSAGFCFGVSLALQKLENAINLYAPFKRIWTLGPIIHNPQVLERFARKGVHCIDNINDIDNSEKKYKIQKDDCILIRAHGITRQMEARLNNFGVNIQDATCPKVKSAQLAIAKATSGNATLLLYGEADHPEVQGLISYAHGPSKVFNSLEELKAQLQAEENGNYRTKNYVLAAQTTQDDKNFSQISSFLAQKLPSLKILATICNATQHRQAEALDIAKKVQALVVVGGKNSGNTRRLASLAQNIGIPAFHIETEFSEEELKQFKKFTTVGLTAGASTPKDLIDKVHDFLRKL